MTISDEDLKYEVEQEIKYNSTPNGISDMEWHLARLNRLYKILEIRKEIEMPTKLKEKIIVLEASISKFTASPEPKLTKELALRKVRQIANLTSDSMQHEEQDALYLWFIKSVCNGYYDIEETQEIAKIIRQVDDLDFYRWCG
jgi:hypothetical protein